MSAVQVGAAAAAARSTIRPPAPTGKGGSASDMACGPGSTGGAVYVVQVPGPRSCPVESTAVQVVYLPSHPLHGKKKKEKWGLHLDHMDQGCPS